MILSIVSWSVVVLAFIELFPMFFDKDPTSTYVARAARWLWRRR